MPRIEKLVPIDGRLGVVLDVPPTPADGDSVGIYTDDEIEALKKRVREDAVKAEREACANLAYDLIGNGAGVAAAMASQAANGLRAIGIRLIARVLIHWQCGVPLALAGWRTVMAWL